MDEKYRVARDVDRPIPFLMWEMQDMAVGVAAMTLGLILHQFILGLVCFYVWMNFSKKAAAEAKRGYLSHFTWALGLRVDPAMKRRAPNPFVKEYL